MKFHIAFVLLVVFGAAQAGKNHEVMTYGSGYKTMGDEGGSGVGNEGEDYQDNEGATAATILDESTHHTEEARDIFGTRSEAHAYSAEMFADLVREKRQASIESHKKAEDYAVRANEEYKKSQLLKRQARDKQAIAKQYEEKAQKYDRISKQQDIKEQDDYRKSDAESEEYKRSIAVANAALALASAYEEASRMELDATGEMEQQSKELYTKSEEYNKVAEECITRAKKEKELARIEEAKGKEAEAKSQEYENFATDNNKKYNAMKFYGWEFKMKAENERHNADYCRIKSRYLAQLSNYNREQAEALYHFAAAQRKDAELFHRYAMELYKQTRVLTASAAQIMKQHRYTGQEIYSKQPFPHSNYHGA
uniref:Mantis fibroin 2 n=1 Tax=Pseudomantis albofimbriata TaxID=627833 RepID=I3PM89_9NEOP|nr:mantis fibroin 2 [Pseudomantis albofimbriata]